MDANTNSKDLSRRLFKKFIGLRYVALSTMLMGILICSTALGGPIFFRNAKAQTTTPPSSDCFTPGCQGHWYSTYLQDWKTYHRNPDGTLTYIIGSTQIDCTLEGDLFTTTPKSYNPIWYPKGDWKYDYHYHVVSYTSDGSIAPNSKMDFDSTGTAPPGEPGSPYPYVLGNVGETITPGVSDLTSTGSDTLGYWVNFAQGTCASPYPWIRTNGQEVGAPFIQSGSDKIASYSVTYSYDGKTEDPDPIVSSCFNDECRIGSDTIEFKMTIHSGADFKLDCTKPSSPIVAGKTSQTICTVTSTGTFNGPVDLSCTAPPESKITCGFNPNQVTPPPAEATESTLVISADADSPPGKYDLTIKGTSGEGTSASISHDTTIPVKVVTITLDPNSGPPGTKVSVKGCCFNEGGGGGTVKIGFDNIDVGEASTGSDGSFDTSIAVPASTADVHSVSVTDSSTGGGSPSPSKDFTVTAGATTVSQDEVDKLKVEEGSAKNDPTACTQQLTINCHFVPGNTGDYGLYDDPNGYCTLGYGHLMHKSPCTGQDIQKANNAMGGPGTHPPYSQQQAEALLIKDATEHTKIVLNDLGATQVSQGQLDALTDFDFMETGGVAGAGHLLTTIRTGNSDYCDRITYDFLLFDQGSPGLQARHQNQADTFNAGTICYPTTPYSE